MNKVSSMRITIPNPGNGELKRTKLIQAVMDNKNNFTYIHAGAGYGKTTLLAQLARSNTHSIWLTLACESDVISFINSLSDAIKQIFPNFDFTSLEYFRDIDKEDIIHIITEAFLNNLEQLGTDLIIFLDDLHTINNKKIKELLSNIMKYAPSSLKFCLGSREALWQELVTLYMKGKIFVLGQEDLLFTKEETAELLKLNDESIYKTTEGWPLAINSYKILLENGIPLQDISSKNKEALHSYLSYEYIRSLPQDMTEFLNQSSCFEELDSNMLDTVLEINNSKNLLDELVERNIFTIKNNELYRYHALFRQFLIEKISVETRTTLLRKASLYYLDKEDYHQAAEYAILIDDKDLLETILLKSYQINIRIGNYNELQQWFEILGDKIPERNVELLIAKGAFLSVIGKFTEANVCLDEALPKISKDNTKLYIEGMIHKARVYRNCMSFEDSTKLLDELSAFVNSPASDIGYAINIEKLYNFCWNSQINEAFSLVFESMEACSRAGELKIRTWYERYLSAIYFFAGNMKECVHFYEKSLSLSENDLSYLDMHGIGIYAAKAYQMLGENQQALSLLSEELYKLKSTGKYEEMWSGYLFAAEVYYQDAFIGKRNGKEVSFETTIKYFILADETAPLYRKTDFQMLWTKMQRLTYSLIFTNENKAHIISQIKLGEVGDYLKCIILARLMGYFATVADYPNAIKCAKHCVRTGEKANMRLHSTLAYGILARAALATKNKAETDEYISKYLKHCYDLGIYEYFKMREDYDPLLKYAYENNIEPEITSFMMNFAGFQSKKLYIKTFGGFSVFPYDNRVTPIKMRTKKERELFAFLLEAGSQGVTKDQIYEAIWSDSDSENIKKLIGVNLSQIKKDLDSLELENIITCSERHYHINREVLECDYDSFEDLAEKFEKSGAKEDAMKLLSLHTGEYLSDFEAIWATSKRLQYRVTYEKALEISNKIQ